MQLGTLFPSIPPYAPGGITPFGLELGLQETLGMTGRS